MKIMRIIETTIFTRLLTDLLTDDEYREMQSYIVNNPGLGKIITGSNGLRKLRWAGKGHGKRGGLRVIYYWYLPETILMLLVFSKNESEDLTKEQIKKLSHLVKEWLL
ncbi:MAG: RelE-like protein cytotoxic translational repressor of toxin-antitoxin stability system [uncultured bacterium]|nr:MAG: RelE-like protein cytotoxic translational repressor of toxin-antitoxin stability system [uncultured bacterium]